MHVHIYRYGQFRVNNSPNFCMSLDCGGKSDYPEGTNADMRRACKHHIERPWPSQVLSPGPTTALVKLNVLSI